MVYNPTTFVDVPYGTTPAPGTPDLDAAEFNKIGTGIQQAHNDVAALDTRVDALEASSGSGAPAHAGARTRIYEASRSVYNKRAANVRRMRAALGAARAGAALCRVGFIGDSLTAGYNASQVGVTDPASRLRRHLEHQGYQVGTTVRMFTNLPSQDVRWSATGGGWSGGTVTFPWPGFASTGGSLTLRGRGTVAEIITSGQSAQFTYSIDGGSPVTVTPNGTANPQVVSATGLADAEHALVINSGSAAVYVYGAGFRPATGIVIDNAALSGSTTADWLANSGAGGFGPLWTLLHAAMPDLDVVFVELGVNDARDGAPVPVANYETNLGSIVDQVEATGATAILVTSNRPATTSAATALFDTYLSAAYDVADSRDVPLLDLADVFGLYVDYDEDGLGYDLASDTLHLTDAGNVVKARSWLDALTVDAVEADPRLTGPTVTLTDAATIAVDATRGRSHRVTVSASGRVLGRPTGAYDGQTLIITVAQDATGGRTWSLHGDYRVPTGVTITPSTAANARDKLAVQYDARADRFDVLAFQAGY